MTTVHKINLEDITIADKYLNGHNPQRCKNALWSAYNVLKKMKNASVSKGVEVPGGRFFCLVGKYNHKT